MNTPNPQFAFNAAPPPMPGNPNNFPPSMPTMPATVNWPAKAREVIQAKVFIDGKPIASPQMLEWAYAEIVKRMGPGGNIDQRMVEGLTPSPVGGVNLGNDNEEQLTPEQRQAEIIKLIPTKLTWQGAVCVGTPEYLGQVLNWMWGNIPAVTSLADPSQKMVALHNWIRNLPGVYELDDAARAAKVQQAPPNPVSDQVTPQVATVPVVAPVVPPPAAEGDANNEPEEPMLDPTDGTKCKNLRGLKTRVTKTHKSDWGPFCQQHGLDPLTGRPNGKVAPVGGPIAPMTPPPASAPLPALVGMGAPVGTPAVVPPPAAPSNTGIIHPIIPATNNPPPLYVAPGQPSQEYLQAQQGQQMPVPPAQQPTSPVQFTPTFVPQQPAALPVTLPVPQQQPAVPNMGIGFQPTFQPPVAPLPLVVQPQNPFQQEADTRIAAAAPAPHWATVGAQPQAPVAQQPVGMDRKAMAQMLGGPVNLIVVRLLEINSVNLGGGVDANQLALLAEKNAREELRIIDLAAASYGAGKQAAQRHFAALLSKHPNCYLLMNGFEFIIPDGFLDILIARTVFVLHVSDRGGNVEIKF